MRTRAVVFPSPGVVEVRAVEIPDPEPDEVLIKTSFTCISPGAEMRILSGEHPRTPPFPLIPGYALTGIVVASGEEAGILPGTRVFCSGTSRVEGVERCWGGHIGHAVRRASETIPLPLGVPLRDAPLARLAAIANRGMQLARPQVGDVAVVIGLGPIGILAARLYIQQGIRVVGVDYFGLGTEACAKLGLEVVAGDDLFGQLRALLPGGASIIVDTTGAAGVLVEALTVARSVAWDEFDIQGTRYVIQGSYPGDLTLPYQSALQNEVTFLIPRDARRDDIRQALELIEQKKLLVRDLASLTLSADDAPRAYELLRDRHSGIQTIIFEWSIF